MSTYRPLARSDDPSTYTAVSTGDGHSGDLHLHASPPTSEQPRTTSLSWLLRGGLTCAAVAGGLAMLLLGVILHPLLAQHCSAIDLSGLSQTLCAALLTPSSSPSSPSPSSCSSSPSLLLPPSPLPPSLDPPSLPSSLLPLPCSYATLLDLHYLTHSEHFELLRSAGLLPPLPPPTFLIIGMSGSVQGPSRMRIALDTWLQPPIRTRAIYFSDADDPAQRMVTLPSMKGYAEFRHAQHRQLRGMRWLFNVTEPSDPDHEHPVQDPVAQALRGEVARGEVEWVLMADDDTFVNVPALRALLRDNRLSARLPVILGNVFDRVTGQRDLAYSVAGAGMVMSLQVARRIASAMYTPVCGDVYLNDDSIGQCAVRLNITNVHSALFQNGLDFSVWRQYELRPLKQASVTWHYITNETAWQIQGEIERREALLSECAHTHKRRLR